MLDALEEPGRGKDLGIRSREEQVCACVCPSVRPPVRPSMRGPIGKREEYYEGGLGRTVRKTLRRVVPGSGGIY